MKTKNEIKNWILENCINSNGNIDISNLDFSDFEGSIDRGWWKVQGNLSQSWNKVQGDLYQYNNVVQGNLLQDENRVQGDLHQSRNIINGDLIQYGNNVKRKTYNDFDNHNKVLRWNEELKKWVEDKRFTKKLEDMTKEELIKKIKEMEK